MVRRSLGKALSWAAAICTAWSAVSAGPMEELKSLSHLPPFDLAKLKRGDVVTQRGPEGDFARGISLESCYFVAAPLSVVGDSLQHWDPTKHPKLGTRLYREYVLGSAREAFQTIRLSSKVAGDRWILDRTFAIADGGAASDLHLTANEIELIRATVPKKNAAAETAREASANGAWGEILRRRSDSLTEGGIAAVAPFSSDRALSPASEFRGLLSLQPIAVKHFRPILESRPLAANGSGAPNEAVGYWETLLVRGHTTLQLGVFSSRKSPDSWQLSDCVYYPSDTYFMVLDLFQLWPVDGGTLVWQVGLVSAPFRSYLGGVDRFVASKQMTSETIDTVKAFRADMEKRR